MNTVIGYILMAIIPCIYGATIDTSNQVYTGETCEAKPYVQIVSSPGCEVKKINNTYCYGKCQSGYIPFESNGKASCSSCKATQIERVVVSLKCQNNEILRLNVEIYKKCECVKRMCEPIMIPVFIFDGNKQKTERNKNLIKKNKVISCKHECRACRKIKRKLNSIKESKQRIDYLRQSCQTRICKERITKKYDQKLTKKRQSVQRKCDRCKECKRRKHVRKNI